MKLTMMIGIPGAGKAEWAEQNKDNAEIISTDSIRWTEFADRPDSRALHELVYQIAFERILKFLTLGQDVIYVNYNTLSYTRSRLFHILPEELKQGLEIEGVIIRSTPEAAIERMKTREHPVSDKEIYKHYNHFQEPQMEEGFTKISEVNN